MSCTIYSIVEGAAFSTILYISFEPSLVKILATTSPSLNGIDMTGIRSSVCYVSFLFAGIKSFALVFKKPWSFVRLFCWAKVSVFVLWMKWA